MVFLTVLHKLSFIMIIGVVVITIAIVFFFRYMAFAYVVNSAVHENIINNVSIYILGISKRQQVYLSQSKDYIAILTVSTVC
jgi:hypothetical protein